MKALDFEYDSVRLSDVGLQLCKFDGGGMDTINFPEITFNTVSMHGGIKNHITSVEYEECLTFTLQICPNMCDGRDFELTVDDIRNLSKWLNRRKFHKFRLIDDEYSGISCNASFNISKVEMDGKVIGLELEAFTDSPFMWQDPVTIKFDVEANREKDIYSKSDLSGYLYPDLTTITVKESGNLRIESLTEDRVTVINNCTAGEVITMDYSLISSSLGDGRGTKIQNDFNWIFPRLASSFKNNLNELTFSLPCSVEMVYTPVAKVGV